LLPIVQVVAGAASGATHQAAAAAVVLTGANFALVNRRIGQPWWTGLLYPIQLAVGIGILLNSIRWRYTGRARWKGRPLTDSAIR